MKSYEEVAKSVFEKSDKYFEEKALRAKRIKTAATAMSCFCLAAVLTVGAVAALNSSLTEYPAGSEGQPPKDDEIPEYTTTAVYCTMPEMATDENGDPIIPDVNAHDDIWYNSGEEFSTDSDHHYNWQTIEEIHGADHGIFNPGGVNVGTFLAYDGALYVSYTPVDLQERQYALTGDYAFFGEHFPCEAYAVKGEPDHIAIDLNAGIWEYRRLFNCDFDLDGKKYEIAYNALKDIDHACGDIVLQTEDFTMYEAVRLQGDPSDTKEYIVDLLPSLQREFPDLFDELRECGFDDYGDAWWIALPSTDSTADPSLPPNTDATHHNEDETHHGDDETHHDNNASSLPLNTLSGVTPSDIDGILAPAAAAAYSTATGKSKSVFVAAETGSEIYSLVDGVVVMAEYNDEYGCTVEVDVGNGKCVKHYHLSGTLVKVGDTVTRGQVIGHAGTTGAIACSGAGYTFITNHTETHEADNYHSDTHH